MSVMMMRMKNGEDVVADVNLDKESTVTLKNPAVLMPMRDAGGGNMQMGFGPWIPFSASTNPEVEISREHILFTIEPNTDVANNYRQAFGSGVVVPETTTKQILT